jgi:hypothetical protein
MGKETHTLLLAIIVAFGVFLVARLIVIPANARSDAAINRNKGQRASDI